MVTQLLSCPSCGESTPARFRHGPGFVAADAALSMPAYCASCGWGGPKPVADSEPRSFRVVDAVLRWAFRALVVSALVGVGYAIRAATGGAK